MALYYQTQYRLGRRGGRILRFVFRVPGIHGHFHGPSFRTTLQIGLEHNKASLFDSLSWHWGSSSLSSSSTGAWPSPS